ncbi:MAG: hypothetical protein CVV27_19790 [Candidatus Melainabacteria bacterium HGW-Melainabacteria-1]|nr:MAG: hypothetical protein CVV27_19790 [Candidatus Melainabacteria bacterium HGW-Melainabacteria-1]
MNIYSIGDKLDVSWYPEIVTVLESWKDYDVELEEFRKAVFVKGINHIKASRGNAWIFDPSQAEGSFTPEVQGMIEMDRFPALAWAGVKYFVTINPAASETTVDAETESSRGVQRVESPSVEQALDWIKANP